jgi:hypothetical protein
MKNSLDDLKKKVEAIVPAEGTNSTRKAEPARKTSHLKKLGSH